MSKIAADPNKLLCELIQNLRAIIVCLDTREFYGKEEVLARCYQQCGEEFSSIEMVNDAILLENLAQALNRSAKTLRKIERNQNA